MSKEETLSQKSGSQQGRMLLLNLKAKCKTLLLCRQRLAVRWVPLKTDLVILGGFELGLATADFFRNGVFAFTDAYFFDALFHFCHFG